MMPFRALPNAFEWLLGLYSDNYLRLQRLVDARGLTPGRYVNEEAGKSTLLLDVLEQQPYTSLLRLSLNFTESQPSEDPESYWRVYHDAKQAEVTHCRFDSHRVRLFAPNTPARLIAQYRRRMNSFANKWLEHLIEDGYASDRWILQGPVPEWNRAYAAAPGEDGDWDEPGAKRASSGRRREVRSA
jgi:uncharacterized protein YqiB (DUF1249 family)